MFRKPLASIRRPDIRSPDQLEGDSTIKATLSSNSSTVPICSTANGEPIYSNPIDNGGTERLYSTIDETNTTTEKGRGCLQECVIPAKGSKSGPLPEAPLELLAEIQRELPVYFGNHDTDKYYGVFRRQNSEKFRDTDSIRFMKQNRLSWWSSPVKSSETSTMADGSPQQLHQARQDIYEVLEESHRDSDGNYTTAINRQNCEQSNQSSSTCLDNGVKKVHDYEVIPDEFFLKQRELRDATPAAAPIAAGAAHVATTSSSAVSVSSTNPFLVGVNRSDGNATGNLPVVADMDFFLHSSSPTADLAQASLYDVPCSPQPGSEDKGRCISSSLYTSFDLNLASRGNDCADDGSSTYDLPRKLEAGRAFHPPAPIEEPEELACEVNKHYDVPASLPHFATTPRRVIPEPRRSLFQQEYIGNADEKVDIYCTFPRTRHHQQDYHHHDLYEHIREKPSSTTISTISEAPRGSVTSPQRYLADPSRQGPGPAEMLVFPDTYDSPMQMDPPRGEQDLDGASDLSSLLLNEPTYDFPLMACTSTPPPPPVPLSPPPPLEPPPPPPFSTSPLPPPRCSPSALVPVTSSLSLSYPSPPTQPPPVPMRQQSPTSSGPGTAPTTDSGRSSSSSSGVSSTTATRSFVYSTAIEHQFREQIVSATPRFPPVPAPRQKVPPPLPPKAEITSPRSRPYNEHRKFSLQNTSSSSPAKEPVLAETGSSWYLDTNQIRNCDIPHRELAGSSEDGSTDPSSLPSMSPAYSSPLKHSPSGKSYAGGSAGSGLQQRSGSKIFSSAMKISSKLMRKQSATATVSSASWDSNSADDSDTTDGMVLYFSQLDGRKDYCQRLCVIGDGFLKFYDNDSMTSPSLCLCYDEVTLLLARRDICPSSKTTPSLFLIDVRANGQSRGLGFTSAIERAEFLRRVNQSFNPACLQLQGEVWASGVLWCRYSASGDWQNVKAVLHGKEFTPIPTDRSESDYTDITRVATASANLTLDLRKAKAVEWTPVSQGVSGNESAPVVTASPAANGGSPPMERIFHIVFPGQTVYLRGTTSHETLAWFDLLEKTHSTYLDKTLLSEQYLNAENVPLAVEKCVNFVSAHGSDLTGVYRLAGSHVKIERLVESLKRNAWDVHLVPEDYTAHDVANALRRFLRSFNDCLLTQRLYESWIRCSKIESLDERLPRLKDIISELPTVEHATLRYLCSHLKAIADRHEFNLMTIPNLASTFGPTILYKESPASQGYLESSQVPTTSLAETNYGLTIAADLLNNFCFLFDVSQEDVAKEREIQRLMAEFRESRVAQRPAGDMLVGVHIYNREWGRCLNIKLTPTMTALELCRSVRAQLKLADSANTLAVFEVICDQQLERPLHYSEPVLRAVLRWTDWDSEFAKGNYLLVKRNYIYDDVINFRTNVKQPLATAFELPFAEASSKTFKKVSIEFARAAVQIVKERKDCKDKSLKEKKIIKEWLVENIEVYVGTESNRKAPTNFGLSFLTKDEQVRKKRDRPFLCHTLAFPSQTTQTAWLSSILCAQHRNLIAPDEEAPDLLSL